LQLSKVAQLQELNLQVLVLQLRLHGLAHIAELYLVVLRIGA
jgi:hypothetical protein